MDLPSRVVDGALGHGVVASRDLDGGEVVAWFDGVVVPYRDVPADQARHVLWVGPDQWMIPTTSARFINHGCDPCCDVVAGDDDELRVVTRRPVRSGDELTFDYARVDRLEPGDPDGFWDPRWTFRCGCGALGCRGLIDGYVVGPGAQP